MSLPMKALQNSWTATPLEQELKDLFVQLYDEHLREQADAIHLYATPHLGPLDLVARYVNADGLVLLRDADESRMRYLFNAWRHRNPKRGLHFLRTYLRVLWGGYRVAEQLWQRKDSPYPTALKTRAEIGAAGESESNYYLTSRVRVDLDTEMVPGDVLKALASALAARFVLNMRVVKQAENMLAIGGVAGASVLVMASGTAT